MKIIDFIFYSLVCLQVKCRKLSKTFIKDEVFLNIETLAITLSFPIITFFIPASSKEVLIVMLASAIIIYPITSYFLKKSYTDYKVNKMIKSIEQSSRTKNFAPLCVGFILRFLPLALIIISFFGDLYRLRQNIMFEIYCFFH